MKAEPSPGRICAFVFALLALAAAVQAKTVYINAQGNGDYPSVRAAVEAAGSGDIIVLEQGTYFGLGNHDITIVDKVLTLRSRDPNDPAVVAKTVIDCQGGNHWAIGAESSGGTAHLTLAGLMIRNAYGADSGGAVRCDQADLDVIHCTFQSNKTQASGGVIYCRNNRARLVGCTFLNNTSDTRHGGAVYCIGSQLDSVDCSFDANSGCAIEACDCQLTLTNCTFKNNEGQDGGALYNSGTQATFSTCTFIANKAHQDGGALYNYRSSLTVASSLFAGNTAGGAGGAVQNVASSPDLLNCTFVANGAVHGGAVAAVGGSNPLISHSILWGNTATQGANVYVGDWLMGIPRTATATVEFCDVQGGRDGAFVEADCGLVWNSPSNIDRDPLFAGSASGDYRLSPDSPCINAGDPAYAPKSGQTDLDGSPRSQGSAIDLGAYEFQGLGPIYRFVAPSSNRHFYTISGWERDFLLDHYSSYWRYEAVAFYAFYAPIEKDLLPVYRFWSNARASHFYTISEEERQMLLKHYAEVWTPEGVAFYAYPEGRQPLGTLPVYQLWSDLLGCHLYTMDENEKALLLRNYSQAWKLEKIAWYAYADRRLPTVEAYDFTGGSQEAWYTLTLGATVDGKEAQLVVPDVKLATSSTWMQMTIDFTRQSTTLDGLRVQTAEAEFTTAIKQAGSAGTIPLTLSIQASFETSTPEGPFSIDSPTGVFADFTGANQSRAAKDSVFKYRGSARLGDQNATFDCQGGVTRFELETYGMFEATNLLPEEIHARMPFTFQWHRLSAKDLLAQASVNGHVVQLYVTNADVSTQGLWKGKIAK
jgi:predicted outer membrane repeat protein